MKYIPISSSLFIKNRTKFASFMKPNSIAVFNSNDQYPIGADSLMPFQQNRDLFYCSGIDQEKTIIILFPQASNPDHREIVFVEKTTKAMAIWYGRKLSKKKVREISGIKTVYWLKEFDKIFKELMIEAETIYFNTNEHPRQTAETQTREDRFIKDCKKKYPAHSWAKSNPILQKIRSIKENEEIEQIQKACEITQKGFLRILPFVKPGIMEYEIESEYIHEFIRNRSRGFAYSPIIASGSDNCILHYIENNKMCKDGDLLLMDVGAEYANYSSDMTRTIPVNGHFTDRQLAVYNAVKRVKDEATKMLLPGTIWNEYNREVEKIMTYELVALGLLDKSDIQNEDPNNPLCKKYFMHKSSHNLGLDTHDYGILKNPIEANMVLTVEPGIYIPEENIGIRLEDDVVVQKTGEPFNLMRNIPIDAEEIEELMNK